MKDREIQKSVARTDVEHLALSRANVERFMQNFGNRLVFVSTPFNFRIHGPLPDCWRFAEHGLKELFDAFEILELVALEDEERFLMPIQYTLIARKPHQQA